MATDQAADPLCSAQIARSLLAAAAGNGADDRMLARDARLASWALTADQAMVPARNLIRLWELAEHATGDPELPLRLAAQTRPAALALYGYLTSTAATLHEGLQVAVDYVYLVSECSYLRIEAQTDGVTTYSIRPALTGRGAELGQAFCAASIVTLARAATESLAGPVGVAFGFPPPRSYRAFTETLGTRRIDFDAPVTSITFAQHDLDRPMAAADPVLAAILRRYADTLPTPALPGFLGRFQSLLTEAIDEGAPSLATVARVLAVSPRTLQRRLAGSGTSWRAELGAARRRRAAPAGQAQFSDLATLARRMGYADPRSARRALARWVDGTEQELR